MAFPNITTQYAGVSTKDILQLLVIGNQAFEKGLFYIHEDIDDKGLELNRMSVTDDIIQVYQSMPTTPSNALNHTPRRLDPIKMMIYDHINPMEYQGYWKQFQQDGPLEDKVLNPQVQAAIIDAYSKRTNNQLGRLIFRGDVTLGAANALGKINGLVTLAAADVSVQKAAAVGNITAANVIAILTSLHAIMSDQIWEDPSTVIVMNTGDFRKYQDAVIALSNKGQGPAEKVPAIFKDTKIVPLSGMTPNNILAGRFSGGIDSIAHAAVNAEDDAENLVIQKFRPEGDLYFIKATFSLAVNYAFSEELFMYKPA